MKNTSPLFVPAYNDLRFRLPMAFFISLVIAAYGGDSFFGAFLVPAFYLEFGVTLLFTILIMEWVRYVTGRLDRICGWTESPIRRLLLQIALGVVVPAIAEFLLAALWFGLFGVNILDTTFLNFAYLLIVVLIMTFNIYYFTHYLYLLLEISRYEKENAPGYGGHPDFGNEGVMVKKAGKKVLLRWKEIRLFFRKERYNFVADAKGAEYMIPWSLNLLEKKLKGKDFYRLNRKVIIHRSACRNWSEVGNAKLEVMLEPPAPDNLQTIVSEKKAPGFKRWLSKRGS